MYLLIQVIILSLYYVQVVCNRSQQLRVRLWCAPLPRHQSHHRITDILTATSLSSWIVNSDEDSYETEPTTFCPTHAVMLRFVIEDHERTLRNATISNNAAFTTTQKAQFDEHIRTTLHHLRLTFFTNKY
jgi:hypothetical protein